MKKVINMGLFSKKRKQEAPEPKILIEHIHPAPYKHISYSFSRKISDGDFGNYEASYWEDTFIFPCEDIKKVRAELKKRVTFEVYKDLHEKGAPIMRPELERAGLLPKPKEEPTSDE